jgi:hypothetical protein
MHPTIFFEWYPNLGEWFGTGCNQGRSIVRSPGELFPVARLLTVEGMKEMLFRHFAPE